MGLSAAVFAYAYIQSVAFAIAGSTRPAFAANAEVKRSTGELHTSYDYVVIGGGTSGLTVANRLSESSSRKQSHLLLKPSTVVYQYDAFK
jgi:hypothetical protein